MKKIILSIFLAITVLFTPLRAESADKSEYTYSVIDNTVTITGFTGEPVFIDIPDTIDGCRVTEIRDNAFYECDTLKNITIPATVEKIGHHAFYACSALESIVIPDSEIGMGCFCGNSSLKSVTISENIIQLPESCFRSCTTLKNIVIPQNVTDIGDFCFSGCTSLSNVSLGEKVHNIGDCSFYMCDSMKYIYIPPSVDEIGVYAVGFLPTSDGTEKVDDFTIIGVKKSTAENYADENSFTFENASDSIHAFAVQCISGKRIDIPSIILIGSGIFLAIIIIISKYKKNSYKK